MSRRKIVILSLIAFLFAVMAFFPPLLKIDRSPYTQNAFYRRMQQNLDQVKNASIESNQVMRAGFSKENITPGYPTPLAGYGNRFGARYKSVRDSVYVRTMVLDNGVRHVALVSVDMLIFPPTVAAILKQDLPLIGFSLDNTYLAATHTHNSMGGWGEHLAGRIVCGKYDDSVVFSIAHAIIRSIVKASQNALPATLKWGHLPVSHSIRNRLVEKGKIDTLLRVLEVARNDSSKLILTSFTAHPTCLSQDDLVLSGDYPGKLIDNLEARGYTFAMFMAGAMGSMTGQLPAGESCINWTAEELTQALLKQRHLLTPVQGTSLAMREVKLELREPQFRVSQDWRLPPWWFKNLFGEYPADLTVLRIGDVVMLGTPCDFSGELTGPIDERAAQLGLKAMVTGFNGSYIGYITKDEHYDVDNGETRLMNWYGPGNGQYLSECMMRLMEKVSQ